MPSVIAGLSVNSGARAVTQRGLDIQMRTIDTDVDMNEPVGGGGRNVQLKPIGHGQANPGRRRRDWVIGGGGIRPTEADTGSKGNGRIRSDLGEIADDAIFIIVVRGVETIPNAPNQ